MAKIRAAQRTNDRQRISDHLNRWKWKEKNERNTPRDYFAQQARALNTEVRQQMLLTNPFRLWCVSSWWENKVHVGAFCWTRKEEIRTNSGTHAPKIGMKCLFKNGINDCTFTSDLVRWWIHCPHSRMLSILVIAVQFWSNHWISFLRMDKVKRFSLGEPWLQGAPKHLPTAGFCGPTTFELILVQAQKKNIENLPDMSLLCRSHHLRQLSQGHKSLRYSTVQHR